MAVPERRIDQRDVQGWTRMLTALQTQLDELRGSIARSNAPVQATANQAQVTADTAQTTAASKSAVLRTAEAPTAEEASPQDLWIPPDTNTPHALDETTGEWEPIPDKTATDAAAAADAAAQDAAVAKSRWQIVFAAPDAAADPGDADGDVRYQMDGVGGKFVAQWVWDAAGQSWNETPFDGTMLVNVVADSVKAGAIDGLTINGVNVTGGTFSTAKASATSSWLRLNANVLQFFDGSDVQRGYARAENGLLSLAGIGDNNVTSTLLLGRRAYSTPRTGQSTTADLNVGSVIVQGTLMVRDYIRDDYSVNALTFPSQITGQGRRVVGNSFTLPTTENVESSGGQLIDALRWDAASQKAILTVDDVVSRANPGVSILSSNNYMEMAASLSISDSTPTFVTGWVLSGNSTNGNLATVSGNLISLVNAGLYEVTAVSSSPATSATLTGRNFVQLQTGSAMDDSRLGRMPSNENLITLSGIPYRTTAANGPLRMAAYQSTGASRNMTFTIKIVRLG